MTAQVAFSWRLGSEFETVYDQMLAVDRWLAENCGGEWMVMDDICTIAFENLEDATMFALRWA